MRMNVARTLAKRCWDDPRVSGRALDISLDNALVEVFAETLKKVADRDPQMMASAFQLEEDDAQR